MKKDGPTPEQLQAFMARCERELGKPRIDVYDRLAEEAGMSRRGVQRWFGTPESKHWRGTPYSAWRLWHLVLFGEDPHSADRQSHGQADSDANQ